MITKLTEKQIAKFPAYVEKWRQVGLSTNTLGLEETKRILAPVYTEILKKPLPLATLIMPSPLSAFLAACHLTRINMRIKGNDPKDNDQVSAQVLAQVRAQVLDQVSAQVSAQVLDQVSAQVLDQVRAQVSDQVSAQVRAQVRAQVSAQVRAQVSDLTGLSWYHVWPWMEGHMEAGWLSFYEFFEKECGISYKNKFLMDIYKETAKLGPIYPIENFCIVSAKPKHIHLANGRLHNAQGPAVEYTDMPVWALNGVRVPEDIVITPAEKMDPKIILSTTNAEVRREIVRKIGIERVIVKLGAKSLDKSADGVYEMLDINLGDGRVRPYLKMRNPSINTWHVEGVHPDCRTVAAALQWRNQSAEAPVQLT